MTVSDVAAESGTSPGTRDPGPRRSQRAIHTVLLIDGDAVSRRFVEMALRREPDLEVEGAVDGAGAMEILSSTPVHLIIAETDFADMNGLQLFRRLNQGMRLRSVPFLFFTADARVTTKVVALSAGVDDYLVKPCDGAELVARVRAHLTRQRRALASARTRGYSLAGEFSGLPFADLVSTLEIGRRSGTLSVVTREWLGSVFFDRGRIVHAVFGSMVGPPAFVWLLAQEEGHFEFAPGPCLISEAERTVWESAQSLLMESARIIDIRRASGWDFVNDRMAAGAAPGASASGPTDSMRAAFVPEAGTAAQLEEAVRESFTLGDLQIFSRQELTSWTDQAASRERFHALLVADLAKGVTSMLSLAGAPSERWVLGSLSPDPKALGLSFFLRRERLIDLLLLDAQEPALFLSCLKRSPSLVIVAPPGGDGLGLGTKSRFQLSEIVAYLHPHMLLGVGNQALENALHTVADMGSLKRSAASGQSALAIHCLPGTLGESPHDLRSVLAEGIRLCVDPGAPPTAGK